MEKALLVIDMQNAFVGKNHAKIFKYNREELIKAVNERIAVYEKENVFYIRHLLKNNFINKLAPMKVFDGTYESEVVDEVNVVSDNIFTKYKGDALTNPELVKALEEKGIKEIEVVGLDGGGCVALTAISALGKGIKVTFNQSAIGTMFEKRAERYKKIMLKKGAVVK